MNMDSLNKWLTLVANIGVLLGIIVVAVQLQQTQTAMRAESSNMRTQLAYQNNFNAREYRISALAEKLTSGQELSEEESLMLVEFRQNILRYFENLHYQYQIGVLDDEIWQANLNTISDFCRNALFADYWPNTARSRAVNSYRSSFVEVVENAASTCNE
jgi:hypothetical protein